MYRKQIITDSLIIMLIVVVVLVRSAILGGATKSVTLAAAPALSGVVSQSLASVQKTSSLPSPGTDYTLKSTHYFDNNEWVVTGVSPTHNQFDSGVVVLKRLNGAYEVVLGPGSAFDSSYLLSVPEDVGQYLKGQGLVYVPID